MRNGLDARNAENYQTLYSGRFRGDAWEAINKARIVGSLVKLAQPADGASVLDVGFGWGTCLAMLERLGFQTHGVENTSRAVAMAAPRLPGSRLLVADAGRLPYADGRFDLVVCSHVLEHLADDRRAAAELVRVTRTRGWLAIGVPGPGMADHPLHYRNYDESSLPATLDGVEIRRVLKRGSALYKLPARGGGGERDGETMPSRSALRGVARPVASRLLGWLAPVDDWLAGADRRPEEIWVLARKVGK